MNRFVSNRLLTVFLVEDSTLNVERLRDMLNGLHNVEIVGEASNAHKAFEMIGSISTNAIQLDLNVQSKSKALSNLS